MRPFVIFLPVICCLAAVQIYSREVPAAARTTLSADSNDPFTFSVSTTSDNNDPFTFGTSEESTSSTSSTSSKATSRAASTSSNHATRSSESLMTKSTSTRISTITRTSDGQDVTSSETIKTDSVSAGPSSANQTSSDGDSTSTPSQTASQTTTDQSQTALPPTSINPTPAFNPTAAATTSSTIPPPPPSNCTPGTTCATALGVGLGVGGACVVALLALSGRYRRFLAASQQSYRDHRRRRYSAHEDYGMSTGKEDDEINMSSLKQTHTTSPPPEYRRNDELFLPEDVQQVVRNIDSMRQQRIRTPADKYGSISRKPLPKATNFRSSEDEVLVAR